MQQMIQNNPMLQAMSQRDPMFAQMMNNPQVMQAITQMHQAMGPGGAGGGAGGMPGLAALGGLGGAGATPGATPGAAGTPGAPGAPGGGLDPNLMQAAMEAMMQGGGKGGMGGMGGMGGGMPGLGGAANPADTRPAEERWAVQLDQLVNMGFADRPSNLQALQMANGDVNQAINFLLGGDAA